MPKRIMILVNLYYSESSITLLHPGALFHIPSLSSHSLYLKSESFSNQMFTVPTWYNRLACRIFSAIS